MLRVGGSWTYVSGESLCPDLLRLEQIGVADGVRGRVVRAFFRLLDVLWPVPKEKP